jgi:hypothetical protein
MHGNTSRRHKYDLRNKLERESRRQVQNFYLQKHRTALARGETNEKDFGAWLRGDGAAEIADQAAAVAELKQAGIDLEGIQRTIQAFDDEYSGWVREVGAGLEHSGLHKHAPTSSAAAADLQRRLEKASLCNGDLARAGKAVGLDFLAQPPLPDEPISETQARHEAFLEHANEAEINRALQGGSLAPQEPGGSFSPQSLEQMEEEADAADKALRAEHVRYTARGPVQAEPTNADEGE